MAKMSLHYSFKQKIICTKKAVHAGTTFNIQSIHETNRR